MKLLTKSEITQSKTLESKQEIDRGLKLAARVDGLRKTKIKEEQDLEKWRSETLRIVQEEIDHAIRTRDNTLKQVKEAEEARFKVQAPLDVKEERGKNMRLSKENEKTATDLLNRETLVIARESKTAVTEKELAEQAIDLKEKEILANRYLEEKKTLYDEAAIIKAKAQKAKDKADTEIENRYEEVRIREEEVALAEKNNQNERNAIESEKREIADEKLHIQSQQQALKAAWDAIKRLQK